MKFICIHILVLFPFLALAADIRHEGMFVMSASHSVSGCYQVQDMIVPDVGGRILAPEQGIEVSVNDLIDRIRSTSTAWVRERLVFYNDSVWDLRSTLAGKEDDRAIARDKKALRPGGFASGSNYTSYDKGLNGVMIDISHLAEPQLITAADFDFRVGNTSEVNDPAPVPSDVAVRLLSNGFYRVTVVFPNRSIRNKWLQVEVLANENTGLKREDVFYFGNAVGGLGLGSIDAEVGIKDVSEIYEHIGDTGIATLSSSYDLDRNGKVDSKDVLIAFNSQTSLVADGGSFSMYRIAEGFGLSESALEFKTREPLALFRTAKVEVDPNSIHVDMLWLKSRMVFLTIDEMEWGIVYSESFEPGTWLPLDTLPFIERCGSGWAVEVDRLPASVFFGAREME